ncbi:hypothetical protein E1200_07215, partial [Actinomadura sp. GC306]|uniref:hypothetical protein n=1 Tax=Actinomadura sp. GC306 TaxID=2530367 RepID=UPI0010D0B89E
MDAPEAAAPVTTSAAKPDGCAAVGNDQSIPSTAPNQVYWKRFEGVALPFSSSVGPLEVKGDVARCYEHTPRGALFAAVQISVRLDRSARWRE